MTAPADFLIAEAALLDDGRLADWLGVLTPDIDYRVPVRVVRNGDEFSPTAYLYREDADSLAARVERLGHEDAWCEHPRTRTRRFVGNVRVDATTADDVAVRSNLALYCYRGGSPNPLVITGERHDVLRAHGGSWRLARRTVYLDSTVLGLQSLSVLF